MQASASSSFMSPSRSTQVLLMLRTLCSLAIGNKVFCREHQRWHLSHCQTNVLTSWSPSTLFISDLDFCIWSLSPTPKPNPNHKVVHAVNAGVSLDHHIWTGLTPSLFLRSTTATTTKINDSTKIDNDGLDSTNNLAMSSSGSVLASQGRVPVE